MLCFLVHICLLNLALAYLLVAVGCRSRLGHDGKGGDTVRTQCEWRWVERKLEFQVLNGLNILNSFISTRNYVTNGSKSSFVVYVPTLLTPSANSPKRLGYLAHSTCFNKGYHICGLTEYLTVSSWSNLVEPLTKVSVNVLITPGLLLGCSDSQHKMYAKSFPTLPCSSRAIRYWISISSTTLTFQTPGGGGGGGRTDPRVHWRRWRNTENGRGLTPRKIEISRKKVITPRNGEKT